MSKVFKKTETVEEFLARGGQVKKLEFCESNLKPYPQKKIVAFVAKKSNVFGGEKADELKKWSENKEFQLREKKRTRKSYGYGEPESET